MVVRVVPEVLEVQAAKEEKELPHHKIFSHVLEVPATGRAVATAAMVALVALAGMEAMVGRLHSFRTPARYQLSPEC